jgi:hypothetical protein
MTIATMIDSQYKVNSSPIVVSVVKDNKILHPFHDMFPGLHVSFMIVLVERSRHYRDRFRYQEKKSRHGRARDPVFRDPPTPRMSPRSLFANRDPPPCSVFSARIYRKNELNKQGALCRSMSPNFNVPNINVLHINGSLLQP